MPWTRTPLHQAVVHRSLGVPVLSDDLLRLISCHFEFVGYLVSGGPLATQTGPNKDERKACWQRRVAWSCQNAVLHKPKQNKMSGFLVMSLRATGHFTKGALENTPLGCLHGSRGRQGFTLCRGERHSSRCSRCGGTDRSTPDRDQQLSSAVHRKEVVQTAAWVLLERYPCLDKLPHKRSDTATFQGFGKGPLIVTTPLWLLTHALAKS